MVYDSKEYHRQYYLKNKEEIRKKHAQYYQKNKDEIKARLRREREENGDEVRRRDREYWAKNKDKKKAKDTRYRLSHRENINANNRRRWKEDVEFRDKHYIRTCVNRLLREGKITRMPCKICGAEKAEAHHCDYNKPLELMWLCRKHHREWHKRNKATEISNE